MSEVFTLTALPYSCASGADHHVSLFVGPFLDPDGKLGDFKLFSRWPLALLGEASFELSDQNGVIAAEPLLEALDPDAYKKVFPKRTPVRAPERPEFLDRRWRTFPAAELQNAGKAVHLASLYADPTTPPAPSRHPLTRTVMAFIPGEGKREYDESVLTRGFDALVESDGPLEAIEEIVEGKSWFERLAFQLHRARRYYERPESQGKYQERPTAGAQAPKLPRPKPDFHERCTLAGDHPALLRRLGLVVDLRVEDPDRLRTSAWLSAHLAFEGMPQMCISTRTPCEAAGDDLVTVPEGADWAQGRLRLGDGERFALLDVDADGTALKLDRFIWTLPRLLRAEQNDDPVNAAAPALRSTGFTVVHHHRASRTRDRLGRQDQVRSALVHGVPEELTTEDVTRGYRVEVWDDEAGQWFSLHDRLTDVEVLGHGEILSDLREEGFVQGTAAHETPDVETSPVHVHEAMFGWEGWSLSAPKPGMRVRHEDGEEIVEDPNVDPDPVTPVVIEARATPGTLPRLRFGRAYAFRAWAVDLAGNSRPHELGSVDAPGDGSGAPLIAPDGGAAAAVPLAPKLAANLRAETQAVLSAQIFEQADEQRAPTAEARPQLVGHPAIDELVLARLRELREPALAEGVPCPDRAAGVRDAMRALLADELQPFVADTVLASAALDVITPLRPFLRWDPVAHPAIVSRRRYTAGESLRQVVVRSGVTQDPATLAIKVRSPAQYAADVQAKLPQAGYEATSERHLAPPKTSQSQAELHGVKVFEDAIGSHSAAARKRALAAALRESGTLFDVEVPRLDNPSQREPQPGIALKHDPGVPASELRSLPLPPGEAPATGQYVVHDTDNLRLPYLPDPLARGVSLVFFEAGRDRSLAFPIGTEGMTARYGGQWPELRPFRLVLEGGAELAGKLAGRAVRMALPPGDVQRFRLSSSLDRADLELLGPWRSLPQPVRDNEDVAEAAADGWLWGLTPAENVTLVHAVPRPVEAPRTVVLKAQRFEGLTEAVMVGAVDVHGPSTESLTLEASWSEPADDLTLPRPEQRDQRGVAFTTPIRPGEDLAVLTLTDGAVPFPGLGDVWTHAAIHRFGDTRHRMIDYRFRATTRFREYFHPALLAPPDNQDPELPTDDGRSVVGPAIRLSVPSSSRPAAPLVHSVLPLFRWDDGEEPEQPVATRRRRRAGVRIYLERPWYSSGEGELLGVLLAPTGDDTTAQPWVSQWGGDPVWLSAALTRPMRPQVSDFLMAAGLDDRPRDAGPATKPATHPLSALPDKPPVSVLGYEVAFNEGRGLWYADVAIEPGDAFWPFVRLAVARYQPESIDGCHLSAPVRCDYVQLPLERTASVSRTDSRHARVVVSGPLGLRDAERVPTDLLELARLAAENRSLFARLQRRDPAIPTDLGWDTRAVTPLELHGHGRTPAEAAWVGTLAVPPGDPDIPLARPGKSTDWRVTIEEWETLPGDPSPLQPRGGGTLIDEHRLVYADELAL